MGKGSERSARQSSALRSLAPWQDAVVLAFILIVSTLPYLTRLGFYSDDWDFLSHFEDYSRYGASEFIIKSVGSPFEPRPLHGLYSAVLVSNFGGSALPYHVVNIVIATGSVLLLWLVLARTSVTRPFAFATAAIYGLLPQLSTMRVWFAANCATLSLFFFLLGTLCALTWLRRGGLAWKLASLACWIGAIAAYEIFIPLILGLAVGLTWSRAKAAGDRFPYVRSALPQAADVLVALGGLAYKAAVSVRATPPDFRAIARTFLSFGYDYHSDFGLNAKAALVVEFWDTLRQPLGSLLRVWSQPDLGVRLACAATVAAAALHVVRRRTTAVDRGAGLKLMLAGLAVFCLGYAIFLLNTSVGFSPAGMMNRTAVASAIGLALLGVGGMILLVGVLPENRRRLSLSILVALACFAFSLRLSEIEGYWARAATRQNILFSQIRADLSWIPARSTVILDGVCPYDGPGVVLETNWDAAAVLSLVLRRPLLGDVVSARLKVEPRGVVTSFYDEVSVYPYGDRLFVYDAMSRRAFRLTDKAAAQRYFDDSARPRAACPKGYVGHGVPI